ncbi:S8 family serine peptidase [Natronorubrum sp. JWXQ-INN-674]|uniref:S8 family serine peptidase n=1 Tax=Natronorubrum halalkaliphilum TaxID=2691917 RepID=A0A6B0VKT8_9EURY|nr:S8 family serine peptidase [Natronorubrum halalkaliphilum]MXV62180.1 S8 family serine peptidase [Natronorubrum halalkaliphilum]
MAAHRASASGLSRTLCIAIVCLLLTTALAGPAFAATGSFETTVGNDTVTSGQGHANSQDFGIDPTDIDDTIETTDGTVEVVVRLKEATVPAAVSAAETEQQLVDHAEDTQEPLLEYAADTRGISTESAFWLTNAVLLEVDIDRVSLEAVQEIEGVERVHENFELTVPGAPSATETKRVQPESADGTETDNSDHRTTQGIKQLNAPDVWDTYETRGAGVRVAVLDTGIDASHPDLDLHTEDSSDPTYPGGWAAFNETGDRIEGATPYDSGTHGTHVSGTVAGGAASGTQIGVAPDVELLHGLVLNETSGSFAQIVAGMEWALEEDADVISMSFGATGTHEALIAPVRNAVDSGVVVVAAVGNEGAKTSGSPANVYDALSVGAVNGSGAVAPFSGGQQLNRTDWRNAPESWPSSYAVPNVVSHGVGVTSAVPDGGYRSMPGTSMATPHVSGTIALMLSIVPDATPEEITTTLYETAWTPSEVAQATETSTMDIRYGHGIVDASAATDALVETRGGTQITADESVETTTDTRGSPPFSGLVAGIVSTIVVAVSFSALLVARSLARD